MPAKKDKADHPLTEDVNPQQKPVTDGDVETQQTAVTDGDVEEICLHSPGDGPD